MRLGKYGGHAGVLIGTVDAGWDYYSKDGIINGVQRDSHLKYGSLDEFFDDEGRRYTEGRGFRTSASSDAAMRGYADAHFLDTFSGSINNCADLVYDVLNAGEVKANKPHLGISIPNEILNPDGHRTEINQDSYGVYPGHWNPNVFKNPYW
jgi:hypothetical protein